MPWANKGMRKGDTLLPCIFVEKVWVFLLGGFYSFDLHFPFYKQTKKEESTLRCYLRETAVPFYMAKEEVIHYEPRLSVFHDVISDDDIRYLKREASKKVFSE